MVIHPSCNVNLYFELSTCIMHHAAERLHFTCLFCQKFYTKLHQMLYLPRGDWAVICDSAPSGGFVVVLHNMLQFPLFIYQSGLELWCACSEEF